MAYAFRAKSDNGNATGSALTVNKPTGTADGDLIVVVAYLESDTNTWSSVGSGFTEAKNQDNTGTFDLRCWWKIAASEPASWTWTPTTGSVWRTVNVASYSGATGSGSTRVDVAGAGAQADAALTGNQTAPSVTTTADADLVVFCYGNFSGSAPGSMSGFATNLRTGSGGTAIADAIKSPAGATGTSNPAGMGTEDYAAFHIAFFLDTGGGAAAKPKFLLTLGVG